MAQLTIYLDKETQAAVDEAAKRESVSRSKWARAVLLDAARKGQVWPSGYASLLGSLEDPTFTSPPDSPEELDAPADFDT